MENPFKQTEEIVRAGTDVIEEAKALVRVNFPDDSEAQIHRGVFAAFNYLNESVPVITAQGIAARYPIFR